MPKPDITQYPIWIRELIFPTEPLNCRGNRFDAMDMERALRRVFDNRRAQPECFILSETYLTTIRNRFKFYEMEQRIFAQDEIISKFEAQIEKLEKKLKKKKKGL